MSDLTASPLDGAPARVSRRRAWALVDPVVLFPVVGVLVVLIAWAGAVAFDQEERVVADAHVRFAVAKHQETYESHVVRALREIDMTLKVLQRIHALRGDIDLRALDDQGLLPPLPLFTVGYADATGSVVEATRPVDRRIHAGAADELRIEPVTNHRGALLQFTRPLGEGAVFVAVQAAYFVASYDSSVLGQSGSLALVEADGDVLVRRQGDRVSTSGRELIVSDSTASGVLLSDEGDRPRYVASSRLFAYPLAVTVGLDAEEQLQGAAERIQRRYLRTIAVTALVVVVFGIFTYLSFLLGRSRRRARDARLLHAQRVEYLAYHDGLTGLANRSLFSRALTQTLEQARRDQSLFAVMFLDLDRFKQINDTLGHETGDELLRQVARRLESCVRGTDVVARLGGDEFVILLPRLADPQEAAQVARRALHAIAQPFAIDSHELRVTTSIGISLFPDDGADEQALSKNADIAMYHAKAEGKNNHQFFSAEINNNSLERLTLESGLRHALANDEFQLVFQAKQELRSDRIVGAEALLRWRHPELGTLLPGRFISLAEETGLIVDIGRWVIEEACRQLVRWQRQGLPPLSIAVNLSARQFADEQLVDEVKAILAATGADPTRLEIEITETLLMQNVERAIATLKALKSLGIRIAIDDFGTGYSSLSMLRQFPLDAVKIDRSFISDIKVSSKEGDVALTDAIIAMGKALQLTVVAEGVESEVQERYLRERGCDQFQGYYLNVPSPAETFVALLQEPDSRMPR